MNYTIKIIEEGRTVSKARTRSKRRFLKILGLIKWQLGVTKAELTVMDSRDIEAYGHTVKNEAVCESPEELMDVFGAFTED